jgi:cell division septal protein FtsQ
VVSPREPVPSAFPRPGRVSAAGASVALGARRQWQRRRSTLRRALALVTVAALAGFAGWAMLWSSWLAADKVTVAGERTLSQRQVLAAARVPLGTPLVRLDLDQIKQRIAALRPVARVSVHRDWPQTVAISVTERTPVAAVRVDDGSWGVLDKTGVIFRHSSARPTLPLIDVPSTRNRPALAAVAAVVTSLPAKLLAQVRQVSAHSMDSITLRLNDGRRVRWGSAEHSVDKVGVLAVLLKLPARVYDVSVPAQPTTVK